MPAVTQENDTTVKLVKLLFTGLNQAALQSADTLYCTATFGIPVNPGGVPSWCQGVFQRIRTYSAVQPGLTVEVEREVAGLLETLTKGRVGEEIELEPVEGLLDVPVNVVVQLPDDYDCYKVFMFMQLRSIRPD